MVAAAPDAPLRNTRFVNAEFHALGVECMSVSDLMRRMPPDVMRVPERLDFYMLLLITAGAGSHIVDFVEAALAPGTVVFVRPGQVQQWRLDSGVEGVLVLIAAQALAPVAVPPADPMRDALALDEWPAAAVMPALLRNEIEVAMQQLQRDFERFDHSALDMALIRHDVQSVLMRLARWLGAVDSRGAGKAKDRAVYRLFLRELEAGFRQRQGVQHYAARLGYAQSTLTRACQAAEGRSAKQVIDRRIALEAARELVHSAISVAEIGHQLGFSEATNFVKFFQRTQGLSPLAFRHKMGMRR